MSTKSPAVLVRVGDDGTPFFEAKWRDADGRQVKRRLGPAWLEQGSEGGWVKRRGRTPAGLAGRALRARRGGGEGCGCGGGA